MASTDYIDESGHTGDLVRSRGDIGLDSQPVFVLACVGCDDTEALATEIERPKVLHRVQAPEEIGRLTCLRNQYRRFLTGYVSDREFVGWFRRRRNPPHHLTEWRLRMAGYAFANPPYRLWLFVTPTWRRAVCGWLHFCVAAAHAIPENLGWRFAVWRSWSSD